ncbi:YicC family protein [Clostridiaceae bacterium UIB06]|uniref:YicC family protein n=1 Tax=Clostridium thailandense TaxID=2794346 RepID=A0A949TV03_9CLOT|nr:YicC/YloC family endoribonuclease [Clostridium thailandense]MBV7271930.1 YicC family protein [Clostridium thailandense]MCH5137156.1 YicC family protein [Clostridiaceae bacterium UIB06]
MIKSMTGFGRGSIEQDGRSFTIEMKSVNHRYCDLNIKMPKIFLSLEDRMRKVIFEKISRGKVDVFITQNNKEKVGVKAVLDESLADSYVECLRKIKDKYDIREGISISLIAKFPDVITLKQEEEDIENVWRILSVPLEEALNLLVEMRQNEGLKLKNDILLKCDYIKHLLDKIEKRSPFVVIEYKDKLNERLKELLQDYQIDENRIAMEVALFGDKSCIDEEIVRLNSHLVQLRETFNLNEPIGRKLDFILQEMNRETNTIGSKANDLEITNSVLNIKNEIEKIREQIQNIE